MRRAMKWIGIGSGGLLVLLLLAAGFVYVASERVVHRQYDVPLASFAAPTDPASIAEGRRLAAIRGCNGCHGDRLEGETFFDEAGVGRIVAPNLTRAVRQYTDAELERVIRRGVRRDGTGVFVMPSPMFYHLSDADLGAIIAFLRSAPPVEGPATEISVGPIGRIGVLRGDFSPLTLEITRPRPLHPGIGLPAGPRNRYLYCGRGRRSVLKELVDAGYGDRIMFGSGQMVWPGLIDAAVSSIQEAPFLSEQQKRDIFYNNAARFLRLTPEEIARHHGR